MSRKSVRPSKAPAYKGDGRSYLQFGGSIIPREKTPEEKAFDPGLGAELLVGSNMGKPIWILRSEDGREIESYDGLAALVAEFTKGAGETD